MEDWAEIRRLRRAEGMPIKAIARVLGCSKNTVKSALASDEPPQYRRAPRGSVVDAVEPRIRELLVSWPDMPATVIAERIGWTRSVQGAARPGRGAAPGLSAARSRSRTSYEPGEVGQCDFWFPDIEVPVGFGQTRTATRLPVLVMVCGYSRWLSAVLIPSRSAEDLFAGWWQLLARLGGVPRMLVWDGEAAVGRRRGKVTVLTEDTHAFRGTLGAKVHICAPADPEAKGLVERANGYLETSFLPGRTFASPADFNTQLADWLALANGRVKRVLGCAPTARVDADRAAMLTLPPVAPATGWRSSLRLPRDHYVRLDSNDYSVHPAVIGRRVELVAGLDRVQVFCDGRLVADHDRCWARHQSIHDPAHVDAARALRTAHAARPRAGRAGGRAALPDRLRHRPGPHDDLDAGLDDGQVA